MSEPLTADAVDSAEVIANMQEWSKPDCKWDGYRVEFVRRLLATIRARDAEIARLKEQLAKCPTA